MKHAAEIVDREDIESGVPIETGASITANVLDEGLCRIEIAEGRIARITRLEPELFGERYCSAGFVDLQLNGIAGVNFSAPDLTPESAASVLEPLWRTGVTSFCPTLVTSPLRLLQRNFQVLEKTRRKYPDFAASVPCYHLEGPYLSAAAKGAHDPDLMSRPDWTEFQRLQDAAGGHIGILTMAPELAGSLDLIRRAAQAGVVVAIGHTDATSADIYAAIQAGARLSTHLGNGCPEFIHRHRSPIWAQLVADGLSASMICDGFHLSSEVVQAITRLKGVDRCILVTDAIFVTGQQPGNYSLGSTPIELLPNGQVITAAKPSVMAGSTLTMDRAIQNYQALGCTSLQAAVQAASTNPARLLGRRDGVCCELQFGSPANLAVWRQESDELRIKAVYINGVLREF